MLIGIDSYGKALKQIEAIEQGAIDLYVTTRRFYAYNRALQILNIEQAKSEKVGNTNSAQKNAGGNAGVNAGVNAGGDAGGGENKTRTEDPFAEIEEE